jgi:tripartite-type tricarboxylate transporter receptor subunit TctC
VPRKFRPAAFGGLLACLIGTAPQAAPTSDRPITIVVPFGKGTTADLIATVVAETMSKNIGQKVIVELKPGAGGGLAMEQVENAAPDGTTSGLKGYDLVTWFGFGAPAGTPPEIVQRLSDDFATAAADPIVKAKLDEAGLDPIEHMQPADFARLIASDRVKWTPIIKAANISAE